MDWENIFGISKVKYFNFLSLYNVMILGLFKKLNLKFFYLNLIAVFVFAILYYIEDMFAESHRELLEQLHIFKKSHDKKKNHSKIASPLIYHFWFSLMTQTTVGYGAAPYLNSANNLAKLVNVAQLITILFIGSIS